MINFNKVLRVEVFNSLKEKILISEKITIAASENSSNDVIILQEKNECNLGIYTAVSVVINYSNGDRVKYSGIVLLCTDFQVNIELFSIGRKLEERRKCYKQETNLKSSFKIYRRDNSTVILDQPVRCIILNINTGGVLLKTDFLLNTKDIISLSFEIPEKRIICNIEVLRIDKKSDNNIIGYGCLFVGMKMKDEECIARYVASLQRCLMNKRKSYLKKVIQ